MLPSSHATTDRQKEIKEQLAQGKSEADATKSGLASHQDHQANPGPVIVNKLSEAPASKEELKKRSEELNKKE
ncbi:hypothetical protein CERZMDRAFT_98368 [Cercospora zeae-maydis SCOH1-5]|uniref:Uncharacterized protein n=1 Tax=Cercospora zeae-maydis SCOH1-5 TaxID=717836 RepID=A0A6A6FDM2_9PEZI|nr:hypothetical protein CERZMDRAFT_98368 [Cercospora zeae-maydis SCOH1-5]